MRPLLLVMLCYGPTCGTLGAAESKDSRHVLLDDDFTSYRSGVWTGVIDAKAEYHYLPELAPHGPWSVSTFRSGSGWQRAWRVIEDNDNRVLAQTFDNRKERHCHPMVVAGDALWGDYRLEVRFAPQSDDGRSGVVFRYRNDKCNYFFGVEGSKASLRLIQNETAFRKPYEKILAEAKCSWTPEQMLTAVIDVRDNRIRATLDGGVELTATDDTYAIGKIGLAADVPTHFEHVRVTTTPAEADRVASQIAERDTTEAELQAANPKPVLWKKLKIDGFGTGRNVRFGDLDGDGTLDVLIGQIEHHGPKDRNSELSCLTAITLEGKKLWQVGDEDPWKVPLTNDVAMQIHDIDGDGRQEVVYTKNQELIIADGATGKVKRKVATPDMPDDAEDVYKRFSHVLGDALYFADFRGTARDADIVLKDRYWHFWVFDDKLKPLWQGGCNTGHYPTAADVDGDGRDELAIGYSLYDDDGKQLWTLEDELKDHMDGVALVRMGTDPKSEMRLFGCASDEGAFFADMRGRIIHHHRIGHAQNPTVANLRDDLPGLEAVSMCYWGTQGIMTFYNSRGEVYHDTEPCQHASPVSPTNWTGRSEELVTLSTNPEDGGMFDGFGRRVVRFPSDGHPDMCFAVLDVTGDCRDEIICWDPYEMWVYTQDAPPPKGRVYKPVRNPLYNASNYQASVSMPGWAQ
ncbi:MAG TPA: hypothetical protein VHV77_13495 [Pirellulales bacterium]|nr:hypothetical protein [Pirellulales bacterium]